MQNFWASLIFLVSVYWPFMVAALAIGLITGWLSLPQTQPRRGGQ